MRGIRQHSNIEREEHTVSANSSDVAFLCSAVWGGITISLDEIIVGPWGCLETSDSVEINAPSEIEFFGS